ncbi:MAG TPA: ABC transporter permease [Vicinamibacterales bacterium]|nr:ABC transporter permease [Vicinamibacterales bacterium]
MGNAQPLPDGSAWRLFVRAVAARAYPRLVGQQRERWWLFFDTTLPLVGLSAYVFAYRALDAPADFVGFVILGGAMSAYWLNILWSMGHQLYMEKQTGNLPLYIIAPAPLMAVLLGMAVGGMAATTARAAAILLVGTLAFGVHFSIANVGMLVAVFALSMSALYGLGMTCASLFLLYGREAWHLVQVAQEPIYLASGLYFPVNGFPRAVAFAVSLIPLTLAIDAIRQLTLSSGAAVGLLSVGHEVAALGVLTVIFVYSAWRLIRLMERLARDGASLTERDA